MREKRLKVTVPIEKMKDVALFVKNNLGFDHISAVAGTDYIAKNEIEVVYFVGTTAKQGFEDFIVAIAERPKRDSPIVGSLVDVWPGAEYQERHTWEVVGVDFKGHPDLRNLLLPEDWNDIPPLRKDYHSPGR
jgi:NADH-quinone oxidoreductase subunit C